MNSFLFLFEVRLEGLWVLACLGNVGFGSSLPLGRFYKRLGFSPSSPEMASFSTGLSPSNARQLPILCDHNAPATFFKLKKQQIPLVG
jgi:hypothetical protein